jgi:hypothetical protein
LPGPDMNFEEIATVARRLGLSAVTTRKAIHDLRVQFRDCLQKPWPTRWTPRKSRMAKPPPERSSESCGSCARACSRHARTKWPQPVE